MMQPNMNPYQLQQQQAYEQRRAQWQQQLASNGGMAGMVQNLKSQTRGMDIPTLIAFAMGHNIDPRQFGVSAGQIGMYAQTQQVQQMIGQFKRAYVGQSPNQVGGTSQGGSTGGATGTNPYGGDAGLAGAGGNALRQQLMDSGQFNPNGSNTYAIQNMDLSGQGASVGQQGEAVPGVTPPGTSTAQGNGATTGQVMPTPTGTAAGATPNPYVQQAGGAATGYGNGAAARAAAGTPATTAAPAPAMVDISNPYNPSAPHVGTSAATTTPPPPAAATSNTGMSGNTGLTAQQYAATKPASGQQPRAVIQ